MTVSVSPALTRTDSPTTAQATAELYGIDRWGHGFFEVLPSGDLALRNPLNPDAAPLSLPDIVADLQTRGIEAPLLLRVGDYLRAAMQDVNGAFTDAIEKTGYRNTYRGVFPIKVNQQAQVVDRIVEYGREMNFGLEAGSKPELVIALSHRLAPEALIVCNGVKDAEFIQLATLSRKLGFNTVIVLESPKEADTVIEVCKDLDVEPMLGVRVKLTNTVGGKWAKSSGDRSTFGMNTEQLVTVMDKLRDANMLHCLQLQHSHLGSQVPDVNDVRRSVTEACRYFTEMTREGAPLTHLDLGGGLGFDYTGEKRAAENSINYTVAEYATNVVELVGYAMDEAQIAHPVLVTESGRAVAASSSMLIFSVLEATLYDAPSAADPQEGDHHLMTDLAAVAKYLSADRLQECLNDATFYRDEMRALFRRNYIDLRQMARAERMHMWLMTRIRALAAEVEDGSDVDEQLEEMSDIYHCNFSLFQSLPDVWAIDQLHPITPLQMLDQTPDRRAILSDITCDSDGKIDQFILSDRVAGALPVHSLPEDHPYYMGVFFVGAYQETLGDLHNLFGDTNVVTIELLPEGGFDLAHEQEGDTIAEVLSYVEYDPTDCIAAFRRIVDSATSAGRLASSERRDLMRAFRESIAGYTYYE
ncbi:biosynthetic arginine decarboxylase [Tropicimonas sp. S265A]|uniref:biosynthetic arginine decarboxylase n=1 Tax=Tropicimonas sp. S265A TaxID=3415134 RepID=UPI003C7BBE35